MRRSTWAEDRHTFNMVIFKGPNIEEVTKDQKEVSEPTTFSLSLIGFTSDGICRIQVGYNLKFGNTGYFRTF